MMSERFWKIAAWGYVIALVALTFAHLNIPGQIGNPFNMYRVLALGAAGMLIRIAYPQAPSGACLMMIGGVFGLGLAHFFADGTYGSPLDIIADMAAGLWGIVLGALINRTRMSADGRRSLLQ
jgi:hypothetical protein